MVFLGAFLGFLFGYWVSSNIGPLLNEWSYLVYSLMNSTLSNLRSFHCPYLFYRFWPWLNLVLLNAIALLYMNDHC